MEFNHADALMLLFATIGPLKVTIVCASLTAGASDETLKRVAGRSVVTAAAVCLAFALFGELILKVFKVSVPAFQAAGGIIVLLYSIEMVGGKKTAAPTPLPGSNEPPEDIAIYPLAIPLMASVSGLVAIVSLLAQRDDLPAVAFLIGAIAGIMGINYACLRGCRYLVRYAGAAAIQVVEKVMGVILAALGVELFMMGVTGFGFVPRHSP